jgi:hypothetical protein
MPVDHLVACDDNLGPQSQFYLVSYYKVRRYDSVISERVTIPNRHNYQVIVTCQRLVNYSSLRKGTVERSDNLNTRLDDI